MSSSSSSCLKVAVKQHIKEKQNQYFFLSFVFVVILRDFSFEIIHSTMALAVQQVSSMASSTSLTTVSTNSTTSRPTRPVTAAANRNLNTKFIVDWNDSSASTSLNKIKTNDENLQEAFQRFRQQRMVSLK